MKDTGVKWIASYIIDNILAKVCNPLLLGFGIENEYVPLLLQLLTVKFGYCI